MRSKANNLMVASVRELAIALASDDDKETFGRIRQVETFLRMAKQELK